MKNKYVMFMVLMGWIGIVSFGWVMLSRYENAPGHAPLSLDYWPSTSKITRIPDLPTLLMFVHPHCPCTRASMTEFSLIMTHCQKKVKAQVVFVKPKEFLQDWVKTDLWHSAVQIPGVQVMMDDRGKEADIFHAHISGQTMLYDPQGKLVFSGGITSSRGHEGDNDGQEAIVLFLTKGIIPKNKTPFFGCVLFGSRQEKS